MSSSLGSEANVLRVLKTQEKEYVGVIKNVARWRTSHLLVDGRSCSFGQSNDLQADCDSHFLFLKAWYEQVISLPMKDL